MARAAPAVDRIVAVLNHLAAEPERAFTLSELAGALGLNKATAHALLSALVETGYLVRDSTKSYTLGPALISIGNAAVTSNPAVRIAAPYMAELSSAFDLECMASTVVGNEIVLLSRAGSPRPFGIHAQPGHRLPFVPPLGTIFVAWAGEDAIEGWLSRLKRRPNDQLDGYRAGLSVVREWGFSVGLGHSVTEGAEKYVLTAVADTSYVVHHIGAPVFGPSGQVVLGLFLIGFPGPVHGSDVARYGERLIAATADIAQALRS